MGGRLYEHLKKTSGRTPRARTSSGGRVGASKALASGRSFAFQLDGVEELDAMLQELPRAMSKSVLRKALTKALKPIQLVAKSNVPHGPTGNLANSIKISGRLNKNQRRGRQRLKDGVEVFVGSDAPHAHLVEFGTAERWRGKHGSRKKRTYTGGYTGIMPAEPFLTRAWESTKHKALDIFVVEVRQELYKAAKRLRTRAAKGTLGKRAVKELLA